MTLDQLRIFVAVAEREHMTHAARHLKLTQSGVSAAIAMLEGQCATPLFDRIGRQIRLTEAGRVFLHEAQGILARVEAAKNALAEVDGLQRGTLRLRASLTIASYWLPKHLVKFRQAYPQIVVQLGIDNTAHVAKAVLDGDAEIGFVEGDVTHPLLRQQIVATDQMVVVVSHRHPLAQRKRISTADLKSLKWVLREEGSGTRSMFETALNGMGTHLADLDVVLELPSNEAIKTAVMAGAGATAISRSVVRADLANGKLARLPLTLPRRAYSALYHRDRYRSRMARALLALIAPAGPPASDTS
jgi:DNA-binding transcriptional LysR family regulator